MRKRKVNNLRTAVTGMTVRSETNAPKVSQAAKDKIKASERAKAGIERKASTVRMG